MVSSGSGDIQAGTISTSGITSQLFNNAFGTTLKIQCGSGLLSGSADIKLAGLQLENEGTLIIDANNDVELTGNLIADTPTVTAGSGSITMPTAGLLTATKLTLTAGADVGTNANRIFTSVSPLTADTSASGGDQFITEANGLTAHDLDGGGIKLVGFSHIS